MKARGIPRKPKKECPTRKRRYRTDYEAHHELDRLADRGARRGKTLKGVYLCPFCHGWHLTST